MKTRRRVTMRKINSVDALKETLRLHQETLRLLRQDGELIELGTYKDQVYSYEGDDGWQYHWSIAQAKKRAEANGELTAISLKDAGITLETVRLMNQGMNEAYALTTNLMNPVLFVPFHLEQSSTGGGKTGGGKVHLLVDGWHRVFKAITCGVDILPCYVLTEEDAQASLIIKLPPGQGLSFDDTPETILVEEETEEVP